MSTEAKKEPTDNSEEKFTDQPESNKATAGPVPAQTPAPTSFAPLKASSPGPLPCPTCAVPPPANSWAANAASYVYAIGRIDARFPRLSVEKEFAQVTGKTDVKGLTDRQVLQKVLSERQNQYLVRQLCWVMTIQGLETYLLTPRVTEDFDLLVEALRSSPGPTDLDTVIGIKGPPAPPELCNGLGLPIVVFDQIYSFDRDSLIKQIPRPTNIAAKDFGAAAEEVFDRIMQMTHNHGATDAHRVMNFLAVRYGAIYANAADAFARNSSLSKIEVLTSPLSGARKILLAIFVFTNRNTDVTEKYSVAVDATDEFLFLTEKLSPYYDR
jgi:hypothetical protein